MKQVEVVEIMFSTRMKQVLRILGYLPIDNTERKISPQFIKSCLTVSSVVFYLSQPLAFYILKASSNEEYQESTFFIGQAIMALAVYSVFVVQKSDILQQANDFEATFKKSIQLKHISIRIAFFLIV